MKPISFLLALVLVVTMSGLSIGETKDGSKNEKREEFLVILEEGAIKFLTTRETTQKDSQPVSDNAMKVSCEKVHLSGHIDKNGKYQLQLQMTGDVLIAGKDMQVKANRPVAMPRTTKTS